VDDCYRAYGYFRWADDVVDAPTPVDESFQSRDERVSFIRRQRELINRLYRSERPEYLAPEEEIIADLICHDREENSGLQSFIRNFLAIIEFDAHRRGQLINQRELTWYSNCLGKAVTDAIQYFIGNDHPYAGADNHYLAATAAHITHMLRDMVDDTAEGYINIPREYLEVHGIGPQDVDSPPFRAWVQARVELARQYFREGKRYIDGLDVLRCKIAAHWYCARFEGVLDTIERDGYILRAEFGSRRKLFIWLRMALLAASVTLKHIVRRGRRDSRQIHRRFEIESGDHPATEGIP
ncbi:MAG TPA: squalene/phytoene synthase family protein, partial [Anaerolineae bacterium]|nr:squalene/phytoene synthase family protein [Anaerolineae bacterium]